MSTTDKPEMTTDIPPEITTPGSVETRPGTLNFLGGLPGRATFEKVCDNLDFMAGQSYKEDLR